MKRKLISLAAIAVVAAGSAVASAAPVATGSHWIVQPTPNRAVPSNTLAGISCTSGTFCMAVGISGVLAALLARQTSGLSALKTQRLAAKPAAISMLAERWDGTRWRIVRTPSPAGSPTNFLNAVTCSSRRACTAVGSVVAGKITVPVVERWNGSRWSIVKTPHPPKAVSSSLEGVSCPTSRECIAVGGEFNAHGVISGFAERWNGSRWTLSGEFRPSASATLDSVSCSSARQCTAVGSSQTKTAAFTLAERWTAGRWHRQVTPGGGVLFSVSCPAFSDCTAVGTRPTRNFQEAVLAMRWNGKKWRTQPAPEPQGSTDGLLLGVSCPTATSCEAAGWSVVTAMPVTVADRWNGRKWTLEPTPSLTGTVQHTFASVSCGAHVACRAAGSFALPSPSGLQTLVEHR